MALKHFRSHPSDHTEYQKSQFDDILSRFVGDDSVSYTLYAQVLSDDIDRVDECQVTVLMHNAGLLTYPTLNYYFHADYIGKRIVSFIHSLSAI